MDVLSAFNILRHILCLCMSVCRQLVSGERRVCEVGGLRSDGTAYRQHGQEEDPSGHSLLDGP